MFKKIANILINYKDYADKYLIECIDSIRGQDYAGEKKIFIVDNATTSDSFQFLAKTVPEAELILNKNNDGFAKGNNDAIRLALAQGFEYIALFNLDTVLDKSCVKEMVKAIESDENTFLDSLPVFTGTKGRGNDNKKIGAVQARMMLYKEKDKINSLGNVTHFLGFGYCQGYGEKLSLRGAERRSNPESESMYLGSPPRHSTGQAPDEWLAMTNREICYPSGAAVMFTAEALKQVGLFDEKYWMYNEDQDLGWRLWLAGFTCELAYSAVVYHKYEFAKSVKQYFFMERNRIITILKNYHLLSLFIILPAFIIMELGMVMYSIKTGWFKDKLAVWAYFLKPKTWNYLLPARKQAQNLRRVRDKDIVKVFSGRIWYQEIDDNKLKLINPVFDFYWSVVKKIIWW